MTGKWISITIEADEGASATIATDLLLNAGCKGVRIDETGLSAGVVRLTSYVADCDSGRAQVGAIQAALAMLPALGVEGVDAPAQIGTVDEEDWATGWKKYFKPLRVGKHIIITPPWETPHPAADDITVVIDPGMAFGTGTHPTTQLCLAAVEELIRPGDAIADIGTGSGILAIAAAKLGAGEIVAVDNDPLAVKIAAENAKVNGVAIDASETFPAGRQFPIVLANIIADTLIELADTLHAIVAPGGVLVASGIIEARESDVVVAMAQAGFSVDTPRHQAEWVALLCRRPAQ